MAELFNGNGIDTDLVQDSGGEAIPAGKHVVRITGSEVKPTRAGTGVMLILELTVDEGEFEGRKFWENLNISNPNPTAQKIGQGMLKKIVKATGAPSHVRDSNELHGMIFVATTKVQTDDFGDKTVLKAAAPYTNPTPPQRSQPAQQPAKSQPPQQSAPDAGMPWNT